MEEDPRRSRGPGRRPSEPPLTPSELREIFPANSSDEEDDSDQPPPSTAAAVRKKARRDISLPNPPSRPPSRGGESVVHLLNAEDNYVESGNNKAVLLAMCIGLLDDQPEYCVISTVVAPDDPFYRDNKKKSRYKYKNHQLVAEVKRRYGRSNPTSPVKSCNSWGQPKLIEFLKSNPIRQVDDINYLMAQEESFRSLLQAESNSSSQETATSSSEDGTGVWSGSLPFLRLYHCMIDDDVREAYSRLYEWEGREGIDARNSSARPLSFFDLTAQKFNDESFIVDTLVLSDLHSDFSESLVITSHDVPYTRPDKIKQKLADSKVKLFRIISDWEKSGNGNGQRDQDKDDFGCIDHETQLWLNTGSFGTGENDEDEEEYVDGDNRSAFLRSSNSHILYMWHLFDEHDLLKQTLTKLDESMSVSSTRVPTIATGTRRKKEVSESVKKKRERERVRAQVGNALQGLAMTSYHQTMEASRRELMRLQERLFDEDVIANPARMQLIESQVATLQEELGELKNQKESLF